MKSSLIIATLQRRSSESLLCQRQRRVQRTISKAKACFPTSSSSACARNKSYIHTITIAATTTKKAVAADDAISVDHATATMTKSVGAQYIPPRPIFPWRSLSDPLPRLVQPIKPTTIPRRKSNEDGDDAENSETRTNNNYNNNSISLDEYYAHDYFTRGGPLGPGWPSPMESWFRIALYLNSMHLLGVSWPSILIPWTRHDWESEMENGFCTAFALGVRGMMEDIYLLPNNEEEEEEKTTNNKERNDDEKQKNDEEASDRYDVDVDIVLDPLPLRSEERDTMEQMSTTPKTDETTTENTTIAKTKREEREGYYDNEEHYMLQRQLRQLYQSAKNHSHPSKVNILLRTLPKSAKIESMFPIFGLSRSLVDDHPHLRHTYRNMIKRLQSKHKEAYLAGKERLNPIEVGKFITQELQNVMEQSAKLSDDRMASITIVAQVSIQCKEIFCVRDVDSGVVLQGCGEDVHRPRDVTHLVRFEMVVRERLISDGEDSTMENEEDGKWEIEMGRWQITDWDDLLDGNVFFT